MPLYIWEINVCVINSTYNHDRIYLYDNTVYQNNSMQRLLPNTKNSVETKGTATTKAA